VSPDEFGGGQVQVSLASGSSVVTTGAGSHALIAQSIGGGGGIANADSSGGFTTQPTPGNPRQTHGYGSSVTVTNNATIQTSGAGAFGILAQSIGGGGGLSGSFAGSTGGSSSSGYSSGSSGNNGNVVITSSGNINATGTNSVGIFAQNVTSGAYGMGNTTVTVSATTTGGSGAGGYGVWVDGGHTNTLTVNSGGNIYALSKAAINYTGGGHLNVTSNGSVSGSISLSDTSSTMGVFTQTEYAGFAAEGIINAIVVDGGTLNIGTNSTIGSTATFMGNYTQQSTGTIVMDVFSESNYDQMLFEDLGWGAFGDEIEILFATTYAPQIGDTFLLIGAAASGSNTFSNSWVTNVNNGFVGVGGLGSGVEWQTSIAGETFSIAITQIPEPATLTLALMGLAAALMRTRRRQQGT
jgi:hypothetical protein